MDVSNVPPHTCMLIPQSYLSIQSQSTHWQYICSAHRFLGPSVSGPFSAKHVQDRYAGLVEKIEELMVDPEFHLSAAVYTAVSDVEAEINGWVTYDRQVLQFALQ